MTAMTHGRKGLPFGPGGFSAFWQTTVSLPCGVEKITYPAVALTCLSNQAVTIPQERPCW